MKKGGEIKNKVGIYTLNFLRNINLKAGHGEGVVKFNLIF